MKHVLAALVFILTFSIQASADLRRFVHVAEGIYRADQPDTKEDYEKLKSLGIKTIINLRHEVAWQEKEAKIAATMGFTYLSYPMKPWEYPDDVKVQEILDHLTSAKDQPVFVHCKAGKDRTGMIIGLYRVHYEGWSASAAYAEMRALDFNPLLLPLTMYFKRNAFLPEDFLISAQID
jgi:tyrosine-protein phosphatase SIW14